MAAGQQPDVAQLVFRDLIYIASELGGNALEDMAGPEELCRPGRPLPARLDLGEVDGKTYGLAYTFSTPILFYNADLFRAAGLDPDQPPKTWAEVKAAADAIAEKTDADGFFPGAYGPADGTFVYQAILMSNGGKVRDEQHADLRRSRSHPKPCRCCATWSISGAHARIDPSTPVDSHGQARYVPLYQRRPEQAFQGVRGQFRALRVAADAGFGDKPTRRPIRAARCSRSRKDPVKQRASWELMKFLTSKYGYTIITTKIGYLPLRLDIVDDPRISRRLGRGASAVSAPNLEQLVASDAQRGLPRPELPPGRDHDEGRGYGGRVRRRRPRGELAMPSRQDAQTADALRTVAPPPEPRGGASRQSGAAETNSMADLAPFPPLHFRPISRVTGRG